MFELADVIRELRAELMRAMAAGRTEELQFDVGGVDLELTIGVKEAAGMKAAMKFVVLELGGDAKVESATTQKLTLRLTPRMANSGEVARIAGSAVEHEE